MRMVKATSKQVKLHIFVGLLSKSYWFSKKPPIIVASEASDLIFKIVIFHDVPPRSSTLYTVFSRTGWGGGGGGDFVRRSELLQDS